ncbi:phytoene/squalene synthase family protein [Candidatus Halobonum tyrrellensis]|uniref:Farnesyl-diphosphate farnesyltransferase (Squalene synthase) n=1 Tax=Candidatus Halobonum tyrrellensis G22 TaxID=1324957 RepID=V4HGE2_9EURY|nr:phytoene/squalene synthase family protein [Candidatus Halobonum tyrrellensis]ESP89183.1 farnesyl-diphosphate farnesyltransferase (squalene synthase) [Candidatus Halobonum tyrrellensis G22]
MPDADRPDATAPDADLAWCHDSVQGVSRTFALTVDVLEEPMASYICVGYLLCRVADTVEDTDDIPPAEQARLLRLYDDALDPDDDTTAAEFRAAVDDHLPPEGERSDDWQVVAGTERVVATFEEFPPDVRAAVTPPVREMVGGMAEFVGRYADEGGLRIRSRPELEEYCYYVAGTVGNLITNLLTRGDVDDERARTLYETAEEFGLLLQLVNIAKDVHDDYAEEDNVYLPAEWLDEEGVPQADLTAPEHHEGTASVVGRTTRLARGLVDDAQTYLEHLPLVDGNTFDAWAIPFLLAVGTLRELSASPERAVDGRGVKVSRQEVFAVVTAMSDHGKESLPELRSAIARRPFHRTPSTAD